MTPDVQGYTTCPTCHVLAPADRPHPAEFCERAMHEITEKAMHEITEDDLLPPGHGLAVWVSRDDLRKVYPDERAPVVIDEAALWGGT